MASRFFLFAALLLVFANASRAQQGYTENDLREALEFLQPQRPSLDPLCREFGLDPDAVLAVVAPELIRYSLLKDFFETTALELAYVRYGPGKADFSIGRFQMKPSFAEQLERQLDSLPGIAPQLRQRLAYEEPEGPSRRRARVERLQHSEWQLRYALAYFCVAELRFTELSCEPIEKKLQFFSSAYNYGFTRSVKEINNWAAVEAFPYGRKYQGPQTAYADLALLFYRRLKAVPKTDDCD